jgi:SAF domain
MTVLTQRAAPANGAKTGAPTLGVEPPAPARHRRRPELVVGVLLVVGGALASVLLATGGRNRTPVLALDGDVRRGEVLTADDVATVLMGSDSSIANLGEGEADAVVGQAALTDLPAGTVLTPELVSAPVEQVAPGEGTVGLALEAGQLPSLRLAPGDRVSVVAGANTASTRGAGVVVRAGEVVAVEEITVEGQVGAQRRWWVALRAPEDEAAALGGVVAGGGRVQLVLVGR